MKFSYHGYAKKNEDPAVEMSFPAKLIRNVILIY